MKVNVTSFDGVLVVKGYNRIVPTWQGYFVELEEEDILFGNHLEWNEQPAEGEESWHTPGLKIFSLTHPDKRRSPRAHRFAIKTPSDFTDQCNPLLPNKYYLHAYQARFVVGNVAKSLNSRAMASYLNQHYPNTYHPRRKDFTDTSKRLPGPHIPAANIPQINPTNSLPRPIPQMAQHQITPMQWMPLPSWNQPYFPLGAQFAMQYPGQIAVPGQLRAKDIASHQPAVQNPMPPSVPSTNLLAQYINHFKPPMTPPVQTTPNYAPTPTYAQIANPHYNHGAANTYIPSTNYQNQQAVPHQSYSRNNHFQAERMHPMGS